MKHNDWMTPQLKESLPRPNYVWLVVCAISAVVSGVGVMLMMRMWIQGNL